MGRGGLPSCHQQTSAEARVEPAIDHLQRLEERIPGAHWIEMHGHGRLVVLPSVPLCEGWTKTATEVQFFVPQGYPYAKPDCFWTDGDLRLSSRPSALPQNTQFNNPGFPQLNSKLWFSWHLLHWDPSRDDLLTWVASIRDRLSRLS